MTKVSEPFKHGIEEYEYDGVRYFGRTAERDAWAAYHKGADAGPAYDDDGEHPEGKSKA